MEKRLYRSRTDRMFAGVCGGLGAYFNLDPTLIRVVAVVLGFMSLGTALLVYLALAVVIPLEPMGGQAAAPAAAEPQTVEPQAAEEQGVEPAVEEAAEPPADTA